MRSVVSETHDTLGHSARGAPRCGCAWAKFILMWFSPSRISDTSDCISYPTDWTWAVGWRAWFVKIVSAFERISPTNDLKK